MTTKINACRYGMKDHWMQTRSGKKIVLRDPKPEDFCIEDIAHGLSNVCRFGGHVAEFYSVAQHSVLVAETVAQLAGSREMQLHGLLHDASEAYIGDVIWPLKQAIEMGGYRWLEHLFEVAIAHAFGFPAVMHPIVKRADLIVLATEKRDLMGHDTSIERQRDVVAEVKAAGEKLGWQCDSFEPLVRTIQPRSPTFARDLFMMKWRELSNTCIHSPTKPACDACIAHDTMGAMST